MWGSCSVTFWRISDLSLSGIYGGLDTIASNVTPSNLDSKSARASPSTKRTSEAYFSAFVRAIASASDEISIAHTSLSLTMRLRAMAMHPLPVQRSKILAPHLASLATQSTSSSVSGRGISTPSATRSSISANSALPMIYCTGRQRRRSSHILSKSLISNSTLGSISSSLRVMPPNDVIIISAICRASTSG